MTAIFRTLFAALALGLSDSAALGLADAAPVGALDGLGLAPPPHAARMRLMAPRPAVQLANREWVGSLRIVLLLIRCVFWMPALGRP
jgi:hypothetical protein